jgi:hypothetical protein
MPPYAVPSGHTVRRDIPDLREGAARVHPSGIPVPDNRPNRSIGALSPLGDAVCLHPPPAVVK